MNETLSIRVDFFVGSQIDRAAEDMQSVADNLGVVVHGSFNEVELIARPGGKAQNLVDGFFKPKGPGAKFQTVHSNVVYRKHDKEKPPSQ